MNLSKTIDGYRSNRSPLLIMLTELCRKSSLNISIDNRYYNRFIHVGRPIFPVNHNGASVFTIPTRFAWDRACTCPCVTFARRRSPNLRPARQLDAFTVPSIHYVSNICISVAPAYCYKLNCNRFDDHKRLIFFSASATSPAPPTILPFLLVGCCDCRWLRNDYTIPRAPENMSHKNIINVTIYFHIWM